MSYMILHIPTATYLYAQNNLGEFLPAQFNTYADALRSLLKSLKCWSAGILWFEEERTLTYVNHDTLAKITWFKPAEFEIIKRP